jgi:hypothetical protein
MNARPKENQTSQGNAAVANTVAQLDDSEDDGDEDYHYNHSHNYDDE